MTKFLSALILASFAFGVQAASHAGAAPMKEGAAPAASGASAASDAKKADKKAPAEHKPAAAAASAPKK